MDSIFFDIETAPLSEEKIKAIAPKFKAPKNYKSDEALARYETEALASFIADGALHAQTGRVMAIGYAIGDDTPVVMYDQDGTKEASILRNFWKLITDSSGVMTRKVIGFNSVNFDVPFLIRRSWINGVDVPPTIMHRYGPRVVLNDLFKDVMLEWSCGTMDRIKLDTLAKTLGVGSKNGDGALFHIVAQEDYSKAMDYLFNDVEITRACAYKMKMA